MKFFQKRTGLFLLAAVLVLSYQQAEAGNESVVFSISKIDDHGLIEVRITNHTDTHKYFMNRFRPDWNFIQFTIKDQSGNEVYYDGPRLRILFTEDDIVQLFGNQFFGQIIDLRHPTPEGEFDLQDSVIYSIHACYSVTEHFRHFKNKDVWIGKLCSNEIVMHYKKPPLME